MPEKDEDRDSTTETDRLAATAWLTDLRVALAFLTRLPTGRLGLGGEARLAGATRVFPVVGAVVGLGGGLVYGMASVLSLSPLIAALLGVGALVLLTGALHEDGLGDTADGFGGGRTRAQKLKIMRDSRIGAFGVIALVISLGARVGALADLESTGLVIAALVAAGASSRAVMPALMRYLEPARADGLGAKAGKPSFEALATGALIATALAIILLGWHGIVASLAAALLGAGVAGLTRAQIKGQTGDVLGAAQQASEIAFLLALAALR